jgi:hypothetical protein
MTSRRRRLLPLTVLELMDFKRELHTLCKMVASTFANPLNHSATEEYLSQIDHDVASMIVESIRFGDTLSVYKTVAAALTSDFLWWTHTGFTTTPLATPWAYQDYIELLSLFAKTMSACVGKYSRYSDLKSNNLEAFVADYTADNGPFGSTSHSGHSRIGGLLCATASIVSADLGAIDTFCRLTRQLCERMCPSAGNNSTDSPLIRDAKQHLEELQTSTSQLIVVMFCKLTVSCPS